MQLAAVISVEVGKCTGQLVDAKVAIALFLGLGDDQQILQGRHCLSLNANRQAVDSVLLVVGLLVVLAVPYGVPLTAS